MSHTCIFSSLCALLLAWHIFNLCLEQNSTEMRANFDHLLNRRTSATTERCEKLLEKIEASKTIAEDALSEPVQTQHLKRALSEILEVLVQPLIL